MSRLFRHLLSQRVKERKPRRVIWTAAGKEEEEKDWEGDDMRREALWWKKLVSEGGREGGRERERGRIRGVKR